MFGYLKVKLGTWFAKAKMNAMAATAKAKIEEAGQKVKGLWAK